MKSLNITSKSRIAIIIVCSIAFLICAIIIGNLHNLIKYDYNIVRDWSTTIYEGGNLHFDNSHIGNLSFLDKDGEPLNNNWVNIGGIYWYAYDLNDLKKFTNNEFGDIIYGFSYRNNNNSHEFYGEEALLLIYDIEPKLDTLNTTRNSFYKDITTSRTQGESIWEICNNFQPHMALTTDVSATYSIDSKHTSYDENVIIFANNRIYHFAFSYEQSDYEKSGKQACDLLEKRWDSVIRSIDLSSYDQWEKKFVEYKVLSKKENKERRIWGRVLYSICLVLSLILFVFGSCENGKRNLQARKWTLYIITCFVVTFVIMTVGAMLEPDDSVTLGILLLAFVPYQLIIMAMTRFMSKRSYEDYYSYYPIPNTMIHILNIDSFFKKRLLLLFIIYPLFCIVPFPIIGIYVLVFYIIPASLFLFFIWGIKWIVTWLKTGKKMDLDKTTVLQEKARIYCRHCGKLIDADSDYCRYCGKKL